MMVVMSSTATERQIRGVTELIERLKLEAHPLPGPTRMAIGVTGDIESADTSSHRHCWVDHGPSHPAASTWVYEDTNPQHGSADYGAVRDCAACRPVWSGTTRSQSSSAPWSCWSM